jgi:hypothetical protein
MVVEDPVDHRDSGLGSLSLLNTKRQGDRAHGKGPSVVEIAENMIKHELDSQRIGAERAYFPLVH